MRAGTMLVAALMAASGCECSSARANATTTGGEVPTEVLTDPMSTVMETTTGGAAGATMRTGTYGDGTTTTYGLGVEPPPPVPRRDVGGLPGDPISEIDGRRDRGPSEIGGRAGNALSEMDGPAGDPPAEMDSFVGNQISEMER